MIVNFLTTSIIKFAETTQKTEVTNQLLNIISVTHNCNSSHQNPTSKPNSQKTKMNYFDIVMCVGMKCLVLRVVSTLLMSCRNRYVYMSMKLIAYLPYRVEKVTFSILRQKKIHQVSLKNYQYSKKPLPNPNGIIFANDNREIISKTAATLILFVSSLR